MENEYDSSSDCGCAAGGDGHPAFGFPRRFASRNATTVRSPAVVKVFELRTHSRVASVQLLALPELYFHLPLT